MTNRTALFLSAISTIDDLINPRKTKERKPYVIEETITLKSIDYQNFITDLYADRDFFDGKESLCRIDSDGVWHCLLVQQKGKKDGILVMCEEDEDVKKMAYLQAE